MNININIGDLDASQFSAVIDLMAKRDASFEAHLLANFERLQKSSRPLGSPLFGSALVLKYVDKFFPNTRWEEFEAKMLSLLDLRQVTFAELFKYIEPRFGGLRWPELEKFIVDNDVPESMITWYKNAIDWNNPKCDFEIPSKLGIGAKVYRVVRHKCYTRMAECSIEQTIYVKAKDEESAQKLAASFDDDMWIDSEEEVNWMEEPDEASIEYNDGCVEVIAEEDLGDDQEVYAEGDKDD